jgi:tRNA threonylcarbamoyladenosine biosynthesis protein TsaB
MSVPEGQPRIVGIETTGRQGSVALAVGADVVAVTRFATDLHHAAELLPAIDRLCVACGWQPGMIDELHVSAGPGSFTGCRIGITVARSLALATGLKLIRVPTVDVLACNAAGLQTPPPHLVVLLDAQRRQAYVARFALDDKGYHRIAEVVMGEPAALLADLPRPCAVLGEGVAYHRQALEALGLEVLPEYLWPALAENVLRVGCQLAGQNLYVAATDLVPIYVRLPEAEEKWRLRQGAGGLVPPSDGR